MKNFLIILLTVIVLPSVSLEPCNFIETVNISDGYRDASNNIFHKGVYYHPNNYDTYDYIIENFTKIVGVNPHIRGCLCKIRTCVRMCCSSPNKLKREEDGKCIDYKGKETISVNFTFDGEKFEEIELKDNYGLIYQKQCNYLNLLNHIESPEDSWYIWKNGSITFKNEGRQTLGFNDFCLSNVVNEDETVIGAFAFSCFENAEPETLNWLFSLSMIFSIPFMVITFLVYALIPELRNLNGKILMCYVSALTLSFILLSVIKLKAGSSEYHFHIGFLCNFIGYLFYLSIMTSFFWLNVMGYDLYVTLTGGVRDSRKDKENNRFKKYALFAYGLAIFLTIIVYMMDRIPGVPFDWRPKIGVNSCFLSFDTRMNQFLYFHLPLLCILISNITFYTTTALYIYNVKRQTAAFRNGDSQIHNKEREKYFLYLRLFILMGVTWVMESVSWIFKDVTFLFPITDCLNALQGFFIFFLFVWRPKVKALIKERFRGVSSCF